MSQNCQMLLHMTHSPKAHHSNSYFIRASTYHQLLNQCLPLRTSWELLHSTHVQIPIFQLRGYTVTPWPLKKIQLENNWHSAKFGDKGWNSLIFIVSFHQKVSLTSIEPIKYVYRMSTLTCQRSKALHHSRKVALVFHKTSGKAGNFEESY